MRLFSAALPVLVLALPALAVKPPAGGPWKALAPSPNGRQHAALVAFGGSLHLIGGAVQSAYPLMERYLPSRNAWEEEPPMPTARGNAAAGVIGRRIYVAGGWAGTSASAALEVFDSAAASWRTLAPMPSARAAAGGVLDGKLYAVGGFNGGQCTSEAAVYDPAEGSWSRLPSMPTPRCSAVATAHAGRLYVIGGSDLSGTTHYDAIEIYDPRTNAWSEGAPMPTRRRNAAAVSDGGMIYVLGGYDGISALSNVEAYDPAADAWFVRTPMPRAYDAGAAAVLDGVIYFSGGGENPVAGVPRTPDDDSILLAYDPRRDPRRDPGPRSDRPARRPIARARPFPPAAAAPAPSAPPDEDDFVRRGQARPDDFALIVGIDGYRSVPHAAYGERDALAFKRYAEGVLGVPEENVILLTGEKATRTDLAKYVEEWLPKNVAKDSRVYFYYSGHGAPDPEKGSAYLVPWDGDPEFLQSSAYPLTLLYRKLESLDAKEVVVFLDSCFSGAGGRSLIAANLRPLVAVQDSPPAGRRISVLSAASGGEVAGSSDANGHGLFTYYLLKGLRGEAAPGKDHLRLDELSRYVQRGVLKAAHRENRDQHPKLTSPTPGLPLF